jgi:translation initiation factor IF-2
VTLLNKPKIHELAKELNTTSKRLMEKLNEIGIYPRSHMTTLEKDEVEKLFAHIGVVKRDLKPDASPSESEPKSETSAINTSRSVPRIIRKTKVIIRDETPQNEPKEKKQRRPYVRVSDSNDGLRSGFTLESDDVISDVRKRSKAKEPPVKESPVKKSEPKAVKDPPAKKTESEEEIRTKGLQEVIRKKPVDHIVSIKKVASVNQKIKPEDKEQTRDSNLEEQEIMHKSSTMIKDTEAKMVRTDDIKVKKETEKAGEVTETKNVEKDVQDSQKEALSTIAETKIEADKKADKKEKSDYQEIGKSRDSMQGSEDQRRSSYKQQRESRQKKSEIKSDGVAAKRQLESQTGSKSGGGRYKRQGIKSSDADRPSIGKSGDVKRDTKASGGKNTGGLVIPKVSAPSGKIEEKVLTRGERRSFITVQKQKEAKKEQKKDLGKTAVSPNKSARIRKKLDHVIGHTANVADMMSDDFVIDQFYNDEEEAINVKRAERRIKKARQREKYIPPKAVLTDITISEKITVRELAEALKKTAAEVIKRLFMMGVVATQNQEIDFDTAAIIGDEFGVKVHKEVVVSQEEILFDDSDDTDNENAVPRAPVVTVMGHVDHGKTSLLDTIRNAHTVDREAGGITQHIGAYTVNLNGRNITFLDTPGHEAFTAMRARGAQVTDIAILVVAADDGVMPQTVEAINHAKAAGVSLIVAINKIDKPNANVDRVKQELAEHGVLIEEWGGDIISVPVSAKKNENIDQLLEMVLLTADILELKADPNKQAKGTVIEAKLDKSRGPVATLLVQRGTLRIGDAIISGTTFGHIRSMVNDKGRKITEAGPSMPVEITGLSEVPEAGELFYVVTDEKVAKQLVEKRKEQNREKQIGKAKISLEDLFNQIQQGNVKELNLIVKGDVQGTVEALCSSLKKLSNDEVKVNVIHSGVGSVIEADIKLADVSNAIIIGFNVRPTSIVSEMAASVGVDMRLYRVIYDAIEDIEKAMKGLLDPTFKEVVDGHAEVRRTFKVSSIGTIAGSYVIGGKILRSSEARVVRDGIVIYEGKLSSLKRFKDDVREVAAGYECGIMVEKFNDIKEGDIIETFHMEEVER